jgi:hypothetical protein
MTITFEKDNDVIVYTLEKVISHARNTQQIFVALCIWWLASVIGLERGLVSYINNIQERKKVVVVPEKAPDKQRSISSAPRDIQEDTRQDRILQECGEFLRESKKQRAQAMVETETRN